MQLQRSSPTGLVVACWSSCVITVVILCVITVVANQSSIELTTLSSTVQDHETRIRLLESHNKQLRLILEKTQARLYKLEHVPIRPFDQPTEILDSLPSRDRDWSNRHNAAEAEGVSLDEEGNTKGDGGMLGDSKSHSLFKNQTRIAESAVQLTTH